MHFIATLSSLDLSAVDWAEAIGRFHPMLLHMPIGLIVALAVLEFPRLFKRSAPEHDQARTVLVVLLAISAMFTATAGWLLHEGGGYGAPVEWHEWLGIGLAFLTVGIAVAYWRKSETYTLGVLAAALLLIPTAHLGATLTHGEGYLTDPWAAAYSDEESGDEGGGNESEAELAGEPGTGQAGQADQTGEQDASAGNGAVANETERPLSLVAYADVAPLLKTYCTKCHGPRKHKGELALHDLASILAGGEHGAVVVPGDAAGSKLIAALHAPLEADEHMPPDGKKQPSADAIRQLTLWIEGMNEDDLGSLEVPANQAGVPSSGFDPELVVVERPDPSAKVTFQELTNPAYGLDYQKSPGYQRFHLDPVLSNDEQLALYDAHAQRLREPLPGTNLRSRPSIPQVTDFFSATPNAGAIEALLSHQVHVQQLGDQTELLRIDFTGASLGGESISSLIGPIAGLVGELCLYGQTPSTNDMYLFGMLPNLMDLDLRNLVLIPSVFSGVKSLSLSPLRGSTSLARLNMSSTGVDGNAFYHIAVIENLRQVHLWGTGMSEEDLLQLEQYRPDLEILGLNVELSEAIEVEPEVVFTKYVEEATDSTSEEAADDVVAVATPENTVCPVSGKPVVAAFTVEHEGRTIGFCCANCPKSFAADPEKYLAILDAE